MKIKLSKPISTKKKNSRLTNEDVKGIILEEGIGWAIRDFLNPKKIEDKTLARLVIDAKEAIRKVQSYVYDNKS